MHLSASDYLRLPLWAVQLASGAKSFRDNPILGDRALNEKGLHALRFRIAAKMAEYRRTFLAGAISPAEKEFFDANGYFVRQNAVPADLFKQMQDEVRALRGEAREMRQGLTLTRRIGLDQPQLRIMPATTEVTRTKAFRDMLAYAGSYRGEPTFQVQSVLSDPGNNEEDPQTCLHADTFHATTKMWLYMDDVGEDDGPFAYVAGSHRPTPQRIEWEYQKSLDAAQSPNLLHSKGSFRITEEELPALGMPAPQKMAMPANTLVIADTSGFHARSVSRKANHRVEVYATLRRNPFLPWWGGHLLALPPFSGHHTELDIWWRDLLDAKGIKQKSWRTFHNIGPYDPANM